MPDTIVARLNAEIHAVLDDPDLRAQFKQWGIEPTPGTSMAFDNVIRADYARWKDVVKTLAIRPQ
jgi:tripartite-type tricarboxylate transporter receptor subunit TctC